MPRRRVSSVVLWDSRNSAANKMIRSKLHLILFAIALVATFVSTMRASRVKDLASVEGNRENQLVGYGLVIGLAGDGDSDSDATLKGLEASLKRFGMTINPDEIKADNVAAVMITADIPPFARPGSRIDVTVSSIGDAESLQGGVLLQTPLIAADDTVYAVAQGQIAVGGFIGGAAGPGGATVQKNHPTVGIISNGALVEREIKMELVSQGYVTFLIRSPDFSTSSRMAEAINARYPASTIALDSAAVRVSLPEIFDGREVDFISEVGNISVEPDIPARIVINERNGTIVATEPVRISTVAISHGALTITIANNLNVSQPGGLGEAGDTVVAPSTDAEVDEQAGGFKMIQEYPTINQVIAALNTLGVTTREMMSIFQTMKSAGALQADLVIQ